MAYEVLARKWRPRHFDEVIGQEHVVQTLRNAIQSDRVAHAYLFVGPRGVGKTSIARILARALNCEKGPTVKPCDECQNCREILAGSSLDVIEIDAASHTGVDNIRDLRDNARYSTARCRYKVYIIDEVHMLSQGAFNALLKTLEEPPAHVKFMFATTEAHKIPPTILSRCQRFDLRRIPVRKIVGRLEEIARSESVEIEPEALLAIARAAEGGLRDAESALDQLIAFRGRRIVEEDVLSVFGLVARQTLDSLMEAVLRGDVAEAIRLVDELDAAGKDLQRLVFELLEQARNVVIYQMAGAGLAGLELTEAQLESLKRQAALCGPDRVMRVVDILTEAEGRIRYALSRRTLLETALIRCSRAATTVTLGELWQQLEQLRASLEEPKAAPTRAVERPAPPPSPPTSAPPEPAPAASDLERLVARWSEIVERVGRVAPLAKGYLRDSKPAWVDERKVIVAFDQEFAAHKEKIEHPRNLKAINKILSDELGREVAVEFRVGAMPEKPPESAPAAEEKPAAAKKRRSLQEWLQNPTVRKTLELFDGDISEIRE